MKSVELTQEFKQGQPKPKHLYLVALFGTIAWTGAIALSFYLTRDREHQNTRELATRTARINLDKDLALRLWATAHGGVYVPVTEETPPSQYLAHIPERDIQTPSGIKLTLMNPAYIMRQVLTDYGRMFGIHGHLTSLHVLRPENRPDEWESKALQAFKNGVEEVFEMTDNNSETSLRLMRPLFVEKQCLKCHGHQHYKVGDVRGGVSMSVPLAPFVNLRNTDIEHSGLQHLGTYLVGLLAILAILLIARRGIRIRIANEQAILDLNLELELEVEHRTRQLLESEAEKRDLQMKTMQAEKLESLGRLAGGISHDFNNMLTSIVGYTEMAASSLEPGAGPHSDLKEVLKTAREGSLLTGRLLEMASRQITQPVHLELCQALPEPVEFLHRMLGRNIKIITDIEEATWTIRFDPKQLERIMFHLAFNARDAMPDGGEFRITGRNETITDLKCLLCSEHLSGDFVCIEVSDTGEGIPQSIMDQIFEPFYSTKTDSASSGLGLSTVRGFVNQHNGHIFVESESGKGTTLTIRLPRIQKDDNTTNQDNLESSKSPPALTAATGTETILLVEDSNPLRRLARRILESAGYNVLEAIDGDEGITVSNTFTGTINLLLTDVMMPGLKGPEVYREISASRNNIAVLFMSGYTADAMAEQGILEDGVTLISKPFSRDELLQKVREVLGSTVESSAPPTPEAVPAEPRHFDATTIELDDKVRQQLIECAESGDALGCRDLVQQRIRPHHPHLADRLDALIGDYSYDEIIALTISPPT
jgi:signal transduction histidine kinase/CheY-like chemotaxis protein